MDKVFIEQLVVFTTIGAYDWEKKIKQKLLLDIEMAFDTSIAGRTDELDFALDYAKVSAQVVEFIEAGKFLLIERVAHEVAELIMGQFLVSWVRIKITKPDAVTRAKGVGLVIERRHQGLSQQVLKEDAIGVTERGHL